MDQDQYIVLFLKIGLISGFTALTGWVAVYHALTRGGWRRNPIGRTLVAKSLLIAGLFVPQILSLFFSLNRFDSRIAAWTDVVLIGLVTPVMTWRSVAFLKLGRHGRLPRNGHDGLGGTPMLKRATWRSWALPGALLAVFIVLGLAWNPGGPVDDWIYKAGTLGATLAPLLFTGIYAASGNKFWRNDLGTALVQSELCVVVLAAPLCWAIWVDGGMITGGLLAWLEIAGPVLVTLAVLRLCWVFLRIHRDARPPAQQARQDGDGG